jgi:hypothetical protein
VERLAETERVRPPSDAPGTQRIPTGPPRAASAPIRAALWLTLGGWIGAWLLFGLVVAPTAFRVLPSTRVAGTLIGPVLEALQLFGSAAGLLLASVAWLLGRGVARRVLPLAMSAACLYSQFGLSAEIAEIRDAALDPQGSEVLAARFEYLHRLSVSIFLGVGISALILAGLHARDDAARDR